MNKQDLYKNKILWRIYVIWFFRRIIPLMLLQVAIFGLALQLFAKNVFVSKVLQNIGQVSELGYWAVLRYLLNSFLATHPITQVIILVILGVISLILRDLARGFSAYKAMWRRT